MEHNYFNPLSITKYWKDMQTPDLNKLKREQGKFTDNYFPPNTNTLLSKNSNGEYTDKVEGPKNKDKLSPSLIAKLEWRRLSSLARDCKLFNKNKIQCTDVLQGELGDCYFLGSISPLAAYPYLIAEKFRTKEYNEIGYYEMIFFIDGEWQIVFIDDYFPYNVQCDCVAFAQPNKDNVIWPLLVEKGWAKINGGYTNIVGGDSCDPLFALSSFPTTRVETSKTDKKAIYDTLQRYSNEGSILTTSIRDNIEETKEYGLVPEHAYSILRVKTYEDANLIQLRNPWGKTDWRGAWSEGDANWTPELKQYFNYKDSKDGVFWISINDFIYFYDAYNMCHLMYGSLIKTYVFKKEKYFKSPIVFNINIQKNADFSASVIFKHWRFNRDIHNCIRPFGLILAKIDPSNEVEKLYTNRNSLDDIHFYETLSAGNYLLWLCCLYQEVKNDPNFSYTLSLRCKSDFDCRYVGPDTDFNLIQKLSIANYNKIYAKDEENISKNIHLGYDEALTDSGIFSYMICNLSKDQWADITLSPKLTNLILLPPFQKMSHIVLSIPPQKKIPVITMRIANKYSSFQIQTSYIMKRVAKKEIPKELSCSRFFHHDFEQNINNLGNSLFQREYRIIAKEQLYNIPTFNKDEYIPTEILKRSMKKIEVITKELLIKEYPEEMKRLLSFTEIFDSHIVQWDKIPSKDGIYIGEVNKSTTSLQGRGIYIWSNGMKYIGYWMNCEINNFGFVYDKDWNKIYEGEYANGKKKGFGILTINSNERIEGRFSNDELNGNGKYIYSNGSYWEGPFEKSIRHGMGIMTYENGDKYEVLYYYGEFIGRYDKVDKNNKVKDTHDNKEKFKQKERQQRIERERKQQEKQKIEKQLEIQRQQELQKQQESEKLKDNNIQLIPPFSSNNKNEIEKKGKDNTNIKIEDINKNKDTGLDSNSIENKFDNSNNKPKVNQSEKDKLKSKETTITNKDISNNKEEKDLKYNETIINPKKLKSKEDTFLDLERENKYLFDLEDYSKFLNLEEDPFVKHEIPETEEEKNQKMIEALKISDSFIMEQVLLLPQLEEKELFKKVINYKMTMIGNMVNGKLNGRGCIFDEKHYDIGYFKDDLPNGFFRKFNHDKRIKYEGIIDKNSTPSQGKIYFPDGSYYIGAISSKWKLNGFGVFYNKNGESWTGNFEESIMQGNGKQIMENGFLSRDLYYEKGKIISAGNFILYNNDNSANITILEQLKSKSERIYNALMHMKPNRNLINPIWKTVTYKSGDTLIGETDEKGVFNGRGCRIFKNGIVKYYIGYLKDNKFDNQGKFYNDKWDLIYEGQMSNNCRNGFGKEYITSEKVHLGYFKDNKFEGQGVRIEPNGKRYEGIFYKGYRHGKGFEIFNPPTVKRPIEYKEGNVVCQEDNLKCSTLEYQEKVIRKFNQLTTEYPEHIKLLESLKETDDTSVLIKGEKYFIEGHYIGELNNIGFRHGRGIQFDLNKTSFYVGYFQYNQRQGYGKYYNKLENIKYEGQYKNDESYGKGKYYYTHGDTLEGDFNEIGEGKGTYGFKDGTSWVGDCKYLLRNGQGDYYDAEKKHIGKVSYNYNKKVN